MINLLNALVTGGISSTISDEEAVEKYVASQNVAYFSLLYERYSNKVYAKCISILKDEPKAEDAMQDIFNNLSEGDKDAAHWNFPCVAVKLNHVALFARQISGSIGGTCVRAYRSCGVRSNTRRCSLTA